MKMRILHELKSSLLLLYWLLLVQVLSAVFTVGAVLGLELAAYGGVPLVNSTPLWEWITIGALVCLLWLGMGWLAYPVVRPEPAGTVVTLTMWAILTLLMSNTIYLLPAAQQSLGGMLEQILRSLGRGAWNDGRVLLSAYFLLPAAFGAGLLLGRKRPAAARYDE